MDKTIIVKFDAQFAPEIKRIRNAVFTGEQHIDENLDFDGQDFNAVHVLVIQEGKYVGTGRMLEDGHIGRLAVLKNFRGRGLGANALSTLVDEASKKGLKRVYLGAQKQAVGFYERSGFTTYGEAYMEANIEHRHMQKYF